MKVGVIGSGTMGAGIAQVAAQNGHHVILIDVNTIALEKSKVQLNATFQKLAEKDKITKEQANLYFSAISFSSELQELASCRLIIEAIVENLAIKHQLFKDLEALVSDDTILASNTSSLSIASIGSVLKNPSRVIGIHFFNPAPLMPLVEIIPAVQTSEKTVIKAKSIIDAWGKVSVLCKDTPGFIVNRVPRPFN